MLIEKVLNKLKLYKGVDLLLPLGSILLLLVNWYWAYPLLTLWFDHETSLYIKYSLTGVIPLLFVLTAMITQQDRNLFRVALPLLFGLCLSLLQLYYMSWNIAHNPWPAFTIDNLSQYFSMIQRIKIAYVLCSSLPTVVILMLFYLLWQRQKEANKGISNTHGSARLARVKEIRKLNRPKGIPIGIIPKSNPTEDTERYVESIQKQKGGEILRLNPSHMVMIAPSGAGKGAGIIIPTILDYEGPVVITDIKAAENFYVTSRSRREQNREVYVFDPDEMTHEESCSINILDYLDPQSRKIVKDAGVLASIMRPIPKNGDDNAEYFAEYSLAIIQALILFVLGNEDIPQANKHLPYIYDLLCQDEKGLKELFMQIKERKDICFGAPSRLAATVLTTTERELSGALNSARKELRFLDSPIMRDLTQTSSIDLNDIIDNKADLYICIPDDAMDVEGRAVRCLVAMIMMLLKKRRKRPQKPLLMILDEMPLLGRIPALEKALIIGRGYGIKLMCIAQTIDMLRSTYPGSWKTMLATNLSVFIGASDLETGQYISETIGRKTVKYESENKGKSQQTSSVLKNKTSESESKSVNFTARSVLNPDEVLMLGDHVVVAFMRGERPMLLKRIEYFNHPHWKDKADPNPLESECEDENVP